MAASIAAGVHHSANRSTKRCVGARDAAASSTSLTMRATVLSDAPRVVRIRSSPASAFTDPANTVSPGPRATGTLSPVTVLSSKADLPSTISPSHGTRSPGRTWTMSPTASRTAATSSTPPPTPSRRAVRGMRPPRARMPARARPAATLSNISPIAKRSTTVAASSAAPIATAPRAATHINVSMENGVPAHANATARRPKGTTATTVATRKIQYAALGNASDSAHARPTSTARTPTSRALPVRHHCTSVEASSCPCAGASSPWECS